MALVKPDSDPLNSDANTFAHRKHAEHNLKKISLKFLAGGLATAMVSALLNPVDHIKVRLQVQNQLAVHNPSISTVQYSGFLDAWKRIVAEEGLLDLVSRGLAASVIRELTYSSIRMGAYDPIKTILDNNSPGDTTLLKKITAGAISGAIGSCIANPCDLIKVRQQAAGRILAGQQFKYRTFVSAFMDIYRNEGFRGLYKGTGPTTVRASVLTAAQLPSYDHTKHVLLKTGIFKDNVYTHITCSLVAGLCTTLASSPVDVIKSRYMNDRAAGKGIAGVHYKSALDCFIKTLQKDGFMALYRGFIPNYIRVGSHCLLTLPLYEQMRRLFGLSTM